MNDQAKQINVALHRLIDPKVEPCETACMHFITGWWTALGLANVAGRVVESLTPPR